VGLGAGAGLRAAGFTDFLGLAATFAAGLEIFFLASGALDAGFFFAGLGAIFFAGAAGFAGFFFMAGAGFLAADFLAAGLADFAGDGLDLATIFFLAAGRFLAMGFLFVRLDESFTTILWETTNNPANFHSRPGGGSFQPPDAGSIRHMDLNSVVAIFFRWLHVISACILIGSVYFYHVLLPAGTRGMAPDAAEAAERRWRRGFKMTVHVTLLMFLISGIYNAIHAWPAYKLGRGVMHGMFGMHMLLGLGAITLLMIVLAGREPKIGRAGWVRWALIMLVLGVAAGSTLKSIRESALKHAAVAIPASLETAAR